MIKGIDPETVGTVTDLPKYLLPPAKLDWLDDPSLIQRKHLRGVDDGPSGLERKLPNDDYIDMPKDEGDGDEEARP